MTIDITTRMPSPLTAECDRLVAAAYRLTWLADDFRKNWKGQEDERAVPQLTQVTQQVAAAVESLENFMAEWGGEWCSRPDLQAAVTRMKARWELRNVKP